MARSHLVGSLCAHPLSRDRAFKGAPCVQGPHYARKRLNRENDTTSIIIEAGRKKLRTVSCTQDALIMHAFFDFGTAADSQSVPETRNLTQSRKPHGDIAEDP